MNAYTVDDLYSVSTTPPNFTLDSLEHLRYILSAIVLCGGFMSNYDLETYICMIEVVDPSAVESKVKVSLRPHDPHRKIFQKIQNLLEF